MFNHEIHFLSVVICQRVSVCIFQMLMDHYKKQISFCLAECQYIIVQYYYVWVKRYFDPSDTELLRALHSRNSKNIRNPLIFLQKMASYSCFLVGPKFTNPPASKLASDLWPFDPGIILSKNEKQDEKITVEWKMAERRREKGMGKEDETGLSWDQGTRKKRVPI